MLFPNWKYSGGLLVVLLLLSLIAKSAETSTSGTNDTTRKVIKTLIRDSVRYSKIAKENTNMLLQQLYATKALQSAKTARKLAPEIEVNEISGEDVSELIYELETLETRKMQQLGMHFPPLAVVSALAS